VRCVECYDPNQGVRSENERARNREYKKNNKEKVEKKRKEYLQKNQESIRISRREYYKKYYSENRDKLNKYLRDYRHKTPYIKIRDALSNRIKNCVKKDKSTLDYLGVGMDVVIEWIEFNFTDEMIWDNYGKVWNIDHTIPVNLFNAEEELDIEICFDWRNLMPKYVLSNLKKRSKLLPYLIFYQERKIREFVKDKPDLDKDTSEYFQMYSQYLTPYFDRKI
jgi:hypothetical protein